MVQTKVQMVKSHIYQNKILIDVIYPDLSKKRFDYDLPFKIFVNQSTSTKMLVEYSPQKSSWTDMEECPLYEMSFKTYDDWSKAVARLNYAKINLSYDDDWISTFMRHHDMVCNDYLKKYVSLDIEVDPRGMDIKNLNFMQPIVSAALIGNDGFKNVFKVKIDAKLKIDYEDEKKLIQKIYSVVSRYWCVIGWNILGFDWKYLKGRSELLGLDLPWDNFIVFDIMEKYKEFIKKDRKPGEITDNKLDSAAFRMLKKHKIEVNVFKYLKLLRDDPKKALTYVETDAQLVKELYEIKGIGSLCAIDLALAQHLVTFPMFNHPTYIFERYIDKKARDRMMVLPKKWKHYQEKVDKKGAGGLVLDPKTGLHANVWICDFKSLYPNIIRTHNIGVNNAIWNGSKSGADIIQTAGISFKKNVKSLNAEIMDELIETRYKYRDMLNNPKLDTETRRYYQIMSDAYKLLLVSANGILDNKYFKYRNQNVYEATTLTGQWYLRTARDVAISLGYDVFYGDTDSLYLSTPFDGDYKRNVDSIEMIEDQLNSKIKEIALQTFNLDPNRYTIETRFEKIYSKIFFSEKKNYIGRMVWKDNKWLEKDDPKAVDVKGIVMMKYNTIPIVKEAMDNIFKIVLSDISDDKELKEKCVLYLKKLKADLYSHKRDDLLVISQRVDKLEGYKNEPPHIKAAKKLAALGKFEPGTNVEFIPDKTGNIILYGIDNDQVSRRTYDFYWESHVGKWIDKILGREIASVPELDFGLARPERGLI